MQSNNESAKSADVFNLQHQMEAAIYKHMQHPLIGMTPLDGIYNECQVLPATRDYLLNSNSPTRRYIVRMAISNALRAWIDNIGMVEARTAQALEERGRG